MCRQSLNALPFKRTRYRWAERRGGTLALGVCRMLPSVSARGLRYGVWLFAYSTRAGSVLPSELAADICGLALLSGVADSTTVSVA